MPNLFLIFRCHAGLERNKEFHIGTGKLIVGVRYAVYEPGKFNLAFPDQDPGGGNQYV
jgi:hypothetical protein